MLFRSLIFIIFLSGYQEYLVAKLSETSTTRHQLPTLSPQREARLSSPPHREVRARRAGSRRDNSQVGFLTSCPICAMIRPAARFCAIDDRLVELLWSIACHALHRHHHPLLQVTVSPSVISLAHSELRATPTVAGNLGTLKVLCIAREMCLQRRARFSSGGSAKSRAAK